MPIRRAEPSDAEGIAKVLVAAWNSAYRRLLPDDVLDRLSVHDAERRWTERIARPWGHIFVSEQEGRIVGFVACGGSQDEGVDRERVGEIYVIYVHPEQWRQGYGTALLGESVDRLRKDAFEEVILWVLRGNQQAIGFYEGAGFEADGVSRVRQRADGLEMPIVQYRRSIDEVGGATSRVPMLVEMYTRTTHAYLWTIPNGGHEPSGGEYAAGPPSPRWNSCDETGMNDWPSEHFSEKFVH